MQLTSMESPQYQSLTHNQVGELKAKIHTDKGWEVAQQKLIFSGMLPIPNRDARNRF